MELGNPAVWYTNWLWSLPLVVLTVVIHVIGLEFIDVKFVETLRLRMNTGRFRLLFATARSMAVVAVTVLHFIEAVIWAAVYRYLGALPDNRSAML